MKGNTGVRGNSNHFVHKCHLCHMQTTVSDANNALYRSLPDESDYKSRIVEDIGIGLWAHALEEYRRKEYDLREVLFLLQIY